MNLNTEANREWKQMQREWREMDEDNVAELKARLAAHEKTARLLPPVPAAKTEKFVMRPLGPLNAREVAVEMKRLSDYITKKWNLK